jgi:hypothetical protein
MEGQMRSESAKYGHVTRRLLRNERLTGKVLESALSVVGQGGTGDSLCDGIAAKLIAGQQLSDYDKQIMIDVLLLHARLGGRTPINSTTTKLCVNDKGELELIITLDTKSEPGSPS